jgi:hypothetical protein
MSIQEKKQELYLEVYREQINQRFGDAVVVNQDANDSNLWVTIKPSAGGNVLRFNEQEMEWEDADGDSTSWSILNDGNVYVSYPNDEPMEYGMHIRVDHPREAAELLELVVHQASCVTPGQATCYESRVLGDVATIYALIPVGKTYRVLDLAALAPDAPDGFREVLRVNLVQDWDKVHSGTTFMAAAIAEQWPQCVASLPSADQYLRAGYLLVPDRGLRSAIDLVATQPSGGEYFLQTLVVPSNDVVSAMYLRQLLNCDVAIGKEIWRAYAADGSLDAFVARLRSTKIHLPASCHHQIRIAAEHHLIRQWLQCVFETLAGQRGCFHLQAEEHWHLAHTLSQMLDRSQE